MARMKTKARPYRLKEVVPSEAFECKLFVEWLRNESIPFTHIPNATNSRRQGLVNKALGTSRGFPDYILFTPQAVFVEMKRRKGGKVAPEQKEWINLLTHAGYDAKICHGFEEAKQFVVEKRAAGRLADQGRD